MNRSSWKTALILLVAAALCRAAKQPADNQTPPTDPPPTDAPARAALPDGPLRVIVSAISGNVQVRQDSSQPWAPAAVGQEFDEGVEFRTGVRSVVKFKIPPDSDLTIDRLGVVKILRAAIKDGTIKTDVGMKYGRARYDIDTGGRVHDAKIRSSTSVLAIRGTDVILDDTPGFPTQAVSVTGRAKFSNNTTGQSTSLGNNNAATPSRLDSAAGSVAETGRQQALPPAPINNLRTNTENQLVANIPQLGNVPPPVGIGGGGPSAAPGGATPPPSSGTVPPPPPVIPNLIPGRLEFALTWSGSADLQIGVISALGEPITTNPANVQDLPSRATGPAVASAASGGVASANNNGATGGGAESVTWANGFPAGRYDFGVKYASGQQSAQYKIDVIVNGVTLDPSTTGTLTGPTAGEFEGNAIELGPVPNATSAVQTVGKKKKKQ
jgi:hypothetical protein